MLAGLANSITVAVTNIVAGRRGFAVRGKAEESRISYETGIAEAMTAFQEAQASADPVAIILAEYSFLSQELEFCDLKVARLPLCELSAPRELIFRIEHYTSSSEYNSIFPGNLWMQF